MAVVLTKNYQVISTIPLTFGEIRTYGKYSEQSSANATTKYQLKMTYVNSSQASGVSFSSATAVLAGTSKGYGYTTMPYGETTIMEVERIMQHNSDGSTIEVGIATSWTATYGGGGSTNVGIRCPKIARYPMITSAPNFTDEDNPTITYTTTSGFPNATYSACISLDRTQDDIPYREVSLENGSYTFELTNAERATLRNATPNSNSLRVIFFLKTVTGSATYFSTVERQMTIVNGNPTFTHSEVETTQKVINVIGSSSANTIVQNASVVNVTITPTALKGASISSVKLTHGTFNETKTTSPYTFTVPVQQASFAVVVTDSRGNARATAFAKTLIEYQNVDITSFSFERPNPTSSDIKVNMEARYYQITVGSTENAPVLKWKLDEEGTYATIPSSAYTIDTTNNKITMSNYVLSNILSHENSGKFFLTLDDIFSSDAENQIVNKGIATYEAGEFDLQVNGELYVADINGENPTPVMKSYDLTIGSTPIKTGRKIDGQDEYVYRVDLGSLPDTTYKDYTLGFNVATLIRIDGSAYRLSDDVHFPLPFITTNVNNQIGLWLQGSNKLRVITGANRSDCDGYANIYFIKEDE